MTNVLRLRQSDALPPLDLYIFCKTWSYTIDPDLFVNGSIIAQTKFEVSKVNEIVVWFTPLQFSRMSHILFERRFCTYSLTDSWFIISLVIIRESIYDDFSSHVVSFHKNYRWRHLRWWKWRVSERQSNFNYHDYVIILNHVMDPKSANVGRGGRSKLLSIYCGFESCFLPCNVPVDCYLI